MSVELSIEPLAPSLLVLAPQGALTLGSNLRLTDAQMCDAAVRPGITGIILDLSDAPYLDSAGLGILAHTFALAQQYGRQVRLCCVQERVLQLLRITTADNITPIDRDRAASQAALAPAL